jgi:hypothetical protein
MIVKLPLPLSFSNQNELGTSRLSLRDHLFVDGNRIALWCDKLSQHMDGSKPVVILGQFRLSSVNY